MADDRFRAGLSHDLSLVGTHAALEPIQFKHAEALGVAASDGELWNLSFTTVPTPEGMPALVKETLSKRDSGHQLPFVIRRLSDDKIVGSTRYYNVMPEHRNLSIGYTWYSASAQRTAINTECKFMLLEHAFDVLGCISVSWHTHQDNLRSQAAIKRLGAKEEGVLRNHMIMPDGSFRHTHCYSMLDSEWPASKAFLSARLAQDN